MPRSATSFPKLWKAGFWQDAWDTPAPPIGNISSLDGFRGIGIFLVMNEHFSNGFVHFGGHVFLGGFFVMSGFLITAILLYEHQTKGRVDGRNFYRRRAARLLPALWVGLCANLILGAIGYFRFEYVAIEVLGNFFYLYLASYAYLVAHHGKVVMPQLWTLNVEEWFYVLWFVKLARVTRRPFNAGKTFRNMTIFSVMLIGILTAVAIAFTLGLGGFFVPNPISLMMLGCVLAVYRKSFVHRKELDQLHPLELLIIRWSTTVGLIMTVILYSLDIISDRARVLADGTAAIPAFLIILGLALGQSPRIANVFSWKPLVHIGQIIYGMYIWHFTLFLLFNGPDIPHLGEHPARPIWWNIIVLGALSYVVALISWHLVERPMVNRYRSSKRTSAAASSR